MSKQNKNLTTSDSRKDSYILVIGDINIDVSASAKEDIEQDNFQFGRVDISLGGVGRNVAWNLRKLSVPVSFLTAVGSDLYGQKALQEAKELGIDMTHAKLLENETSATILQLEDKEGEVHTGIEDLHSLNQISPDYLKEKASLIDGADWCMVSGNLSRETLTYLTENHPQTNILIDPASEKMAHEIKDIIGHFHIVKPNQEEAEILSGVAIENVEDAKKAAEKIREKGANQVFLTLEDGGAIYHNRDEWTVIETDSVDPVNTTGAGDAFNAALLYCFHNKLELGHSVQFAAAASTLTLKSEEAVYSAFSVDRVKEMMKELENNRRLELIKSLKQI